MLQIHDAQREADQGFEFDVRNVGFKKDWTDDPIMDDLGFHFLEDDREVARVRVNLECRNLDHYEGLEGVDPLAEIALIEVHSDHQDRGIGREVVGSLLARYPRHSFAAFAGEEAEGFWQRIGWKVHNKAEPTESPLFAYLVTE